MVRAMSLAHKVDTVTNIFNDTRVYMNTRGIEYPYISGTPAYTAVDTNSNRPGSYNLGNCALGYLLPFARPMTIQIYFKPAFAYNVASDQTIWTFGTVKLFYNASTDKYSLYGASANDFGDAYVSDVSLQVWQKITIALSASACNAYIGTSKTSFAFDTSSIENQNICTIGHNGLTNYVRVFGYQCSDADVASDFAGIKYNEVYFKFEKTAYGIERTNISSYCQSYSISKPGTEMAKRATVTLKNVNGEFSDDQYTTIGLFPANTLYPSTTLYPQGQDASYIPENGDYNGVISERFLQRKIPIYIETWYGGLFEPLFSGSFPPGGFEHSTTVGGIPIVTLECDDYVATIANRVIRNARTYDTYYIVNQTNEATSAFHNILKLATMKEIYNYCGDSGFNSATITNSWTGLTRSNTKALIGTYSGLIAANGTGYQTIVPENLSAGESFTLSVYINGTSGDLVRLYLTEYNSSTLVKQNTTSIVANGNGWQRVSITSTITDSDSDRIRISVAASANAVYIDCAMVTYGVEKMMYFENANEGTSGVVSYTSAYQGTFEYVGIDTDDFSYTHPWILLRPGTNVLDQVKEIIDASGGRLFVIDSSNVIRFRSAFITAYNSSYGLIQNIQSVNSAIQVGSANKLQVRGAYIQKDAYTSCVWQMVASGVDNEASGNLYQYTLEPGDYWPDINDSESGFEAKYSDSESVDAIVKRDPIRRR